MSRKVYEKQVSFFDEYTGHFQEAIKPGVKTYAVILLSNGNYLSSTYVREDYPMGSVFPIPVTDRHKNYYF